VLAVVASAALMVAGALAALAAVMQASARLLVIAAVLMLAGVVSATLMALRAVRRPGRKTMVIAGTAVLAAAVLVPASMIVDPCSRSGRHADLAGCDLSDEDLRGADLREADLRGADLTGADLTGADLTGADLTGADLTDASARTADLTDAVLDANLTGSDLTGATMARSDLSSAELTGATLATADLSDAVLQDANLTDGNLREATLDNVDLVGANLTNADLTMAGAPGADFGSADLTGARLAGNDLGDVRNLTDEALASALGVSTGELPGETARLEIVFDDIDAIVHALDPVADGEAVPEAQAYAQSDDFHPAVVLVGHGNNYWLDDVEEAWAPTGIRYAQLVIVVEPEAHESIAQCTDFVYEDGTPTPPINRYVTSVTVRVYSAHDAALVGEKAFRCGDPRACREFERLVIADPAIYGEPPDLEAEARPWVADLVNPLPDDPTRD
jgi:uncharacterized protein YjbI with pentapeptide repeats